MTDTVSKCMWCDHEYCRCNDFHEDEEQEPDHWTEEDVDVGRC